MKTNIRPFYLGLDAVNRLRPINFTWKDNGMKDFGLGAEDVAAVSPELVWTDPKGEVAGVKYDKLVMVIINAIKGQQKIIERQRRQIESLRIAVCPPRRGSIRCRH